MSKSLWIPDSYVRDAEIQDIERLAEIDLMMFDGAYGEEPPEEIQVFSMLEKRLKNVAQGGGRMVVGVTHGEINGFATYFRTDKPWDEFVSWEDSTSEGTLEGVVEPNGNFGYVPNMTVTPEGSKHRIMQKMMLTLISSAIEDGIEYGYFVSRIPEFTKWLGAIGCNYLEVDEQILDSLAEEYIQQKTVSKRGKIESIDYELRTYERSGFQRGELVKSGFSDSESLNYGVTFKVPVPLHSYPKLIRKSFSKVVRVATKSTKLMEMI